MKSTPDFVPSYGPGENNTPNAKIKHFYDSFLSLERVLCILRTADSTLSMQRSPFSSKKSATDR